MSTTMEFSVTMYNSKCDEKINVILKAVYRYISVSLLCCTSPHYLPPSIRLIFHQIVANLGMESGYKRHGCPNNYSKTQHGHRFTTELHQYAVINIIKNDQGSYLICHLILYHWIDAFRKRA